MEDNRQFFECQECGAEGSAATDMDLVVEFCPFCGEPLDNIDWVEDAISNSCSIICPRSTNCPRPVSCEKHPSSKKNFSWLSEIKKEIIKKDRRKGKKKNE